MVFTTGSIIEGQFKKNKLNGQGKTIAGISGRTLEGTFVDNKINGVGTDQYNDTKYQGSFVEGKR